MYPYNRMSGILCENQNIFKNASEIIVYKN